MAGDRGVKNPILRGPESTVSANRAYHNNREAKLTEQSEHCPDCNAEMLSQRAIKVHKIRGACQPIVGARMRAANALVEYLGYFPGTLDEWLA